MDSNDIKCIINVIDSLSQDYYNSRTASARARVDLNILMLPQLDSFPKSMSHEKMEIAFCKESIQAQELYRIKIEEEAKYKGLDMLIKANEHKVNFFKKTMDTNDQGAKRGF